MFFFHLVCNNSRWLETNLRIVNVFVYALIDWFVHRHSMNNGIWICFILIYIDINRLTQLSMNVWINNFVLSPLVSNFKNPLNNQQTVNRNKFTFNNSIELFIYFGYLNFNVAIWFWFVRVIHSLTEHTHTHTHCPIPVAVCAAGS